MNYETIKKAMLERNMRFFEGHLNVNIVYVRMNQYRLNRFDDYGFLLYQDELGRPVTLQRPCTTRPGESMLRKPINASGTAILVPGQYLSTHKIDLHNGKYEAVCQRRGPVKVYRDNNLDGNFDYNEESIDEGWFGINCHKAGWESELVNGWSAGCMVDKYAYMYDPWLRIIKRSCKLYGNSLSLTLLKEEWL
jgi:hypothetical protein